MNQLLYVLYLYITSALGYKYTMFKINFMLCVLMTRTIEVCCCTADGGSEGVFAMLQAQRVQKRHLRIGYE